MTHPLVQSVRKAGVVGAGGAGFPTHVKLDSKVDTVIANGAECEPLLRADRCLMETQAREVVRGIRLTMQATGASRGVIAVKRHYDSAASTLSSAIRPYAELSLHFLESYYPAGDEFLLVEAVTGRQVPEAGLPLHVGCLVQNVATLAQISQADRGAPVTRRLVTVSGEVNEAKTVWAPIGTPIRDLIAAAGGFRQPRWERVGSTTSEGRFSAVLGGPMMGRLASGLDQPVSKTVSGVLVLPADSAVVRYLGRPTGSWVRRGRSTCDQCRDCTDLCPRCLLGHNFRPHEVMRAINYGLTDKPDIITGAVLCCECRVCEAYACPLELSPMAYYRQIKQELRAAGWSNDRHRRSELTVHPWREYRQVPTKRLIQHLGLAEYEERDAPLDTAELKPERVVLPLLQHTGAPAIPVVRPGDRVEVGDLIAEIPEGKLGARVHASIPGSVTEATAEYVVISRR